MTKTQAGTAMRSVQTVWFLSRSRASKTGGSKNNFILKSINQKRAEFDYKGCGRILPHECTLSGLASELGCHEDGLVARLFLFH